MRRLSSFLGVISIMSLFWGCYPSQLPLQSQVSKIDTLGILLRYNNSISPEFVERFEKEFDAAILESNNNPSQSFYVTKLDSLKGDHYMYLKVKNVKMVTNGQKVAGIVFTTLGIVTPVAMISAGAPFYIAFWYLPKDFTVVEARYSESLSEFRLKNNVAFLRSGSFTAIEIRNERMNSSFSDFVKAKIIKFNYMKQQGGKL